jgi:hypothetical protein
MTQPLRLLSHDVRSAKHLHVLLAVALVVLALPIAAPPARAQTTHHPQGAFAVFSQCPLDEPTIFDCVFVDTKGGEMRIGSMMTPISRAMIGLDGGLLEGPTNEPTIFAAPVNGVITQSTPLPVPGGLSRVLEASALPHSLGAVSDELESVGLGELTATVEVAGPASAVMFSLENAVGVAGAVLEEPLKIKLVSPVLGEHCYIGTDSDPIHIQLTEEMTDPPLPNMPIEGALGPVLQSEEGLFAVPGNSLVDNSFAVPAASGCGGSLAPAIDEIIDSKLKLPSPAGHNTLVLNSTAYVAEAKNVIASE